MANLWIFKNFHTKKFFKDYKEKLEKVKNQAKNSKIQLDPNLPKISRRIERFKLEFCISFLSSFSGMSIFSLMIPKGQKFLKIHRLALSQH